jgi:hypothetical protein
VPLSRTVSLTVSLAVSLSRAASLTVSLAVPLSRTASLTVSLAVPLSRTALTRRCVCGYGGQVWEREVFASQHVRSLKDEVDFVSSFGYAVYLASAEEAEMNTDFQRVYTVSARLPPNV